MFPLPMLATIPVDLESMEQVQPLSFSESHLTWHQFPSCCTIPLSFHEGRFNLSTFDERSHVDGHLRTLSYALLIIFMRMRTNFDVVMYA